MNSEHSHTTSGKLSLVVQVLFVAAVIAGVFWFDKYINRENQYDKTGIIGSASLMIDFEDMQKMFEGQIINDMTVLDALNAAMTAGQIHLLYTVNQNNDTDVYEINGHVEKDGKLFSFYVNSKRIDESDINRTILKNGDKITVKLE